MRLEGHHFLTTKRSFWKINRTVITFYCVFLFKMKMSSEAKLLHHPGMVLYAVMTSSLDVIPLITCLLTTEINNMTQNVDLNIILLIQK